jgi:hypothetical protein
LWSMGKCAYAKPIISRAWVDTPGLHGLIDGQVWTHGIAELAEGSARQPELTGVQTVACALMRVDDLLNRVLSTRFAALRRLRRPWRTACALIVPKWQFVWRTTSVSA